MGLETAEMEAADKVKIRRARSFRSAVLGQATARVERGGGGLHACHRSSFVAQRLAIDGRDIRARVRLLKMPTVI